MLPDDFVPSWFKLTNYQFFDKHFQEYHHRIRSLPAGDLITNGLSFS